MARPSSPNRRYTLFSVGGIGCKGDWRELLESCDFGCLPIFSQRMRKGTAMKPARFMNAPYPQEGDYISVSYAFSRL
jgi:hypothetical protein